MKVKSKIIQSINLSKCFGLNKENEFRCIDYKVKVGDFVSLQLYNNLNFDNFLYQDIEGTCIYIKNKGFFNLIILRNLIRKYEVKVLLFSKFLYTLRIIKFRYEQKFVRIFNKCKLYLLKL